MQLIAVRLFHSWNNAITIQFQFFTDAGPFSLAGLQEAVYLQNKSQNLTRKGAYFKMSTLKSV